MLVADIMVTDVKTARADTPISEIATQMCLNGFSGMPVVDDDRRIIGIISEKDILHHMFPDVGELLANGTPPDYEAMERDYHGVIGLKASDLMTREVATVEPRFPALKAAAMMWLRQFRRIPVAEHGRHGFPGQAGRGLVAQLARVEHALAGIAEDHVIGLEPVGGGRRTVHHRADDDPVGLPGGVEIEVEVGLVERFAQVGFAPFEVIDGLEGELGRAHV